jgi:hypothetical protein
MGSVVDVGPGAADYPSSQSIFILRYRLRLRVLDKRLRWEYR